MYAGLHVVSGVFFAVDGEERSMQTRALFEPTIRGGAVCTVFVEVIVDTAVSTYKLTS